MGRSPTTGDGSTLSVGISSFRSRDGCALWEDRMGTKVDGFASLWKKGEPGNEAREEVQQEKDFPVLGAFQPKAPAVGTEARA